MPAQAVNFILIYGDKWLKGEAESGGENRSR